MTTLLSIQSEVAGARVGNGAARFALERLGVEIIALPTTLYGRRPDRGPPGGAPVSAETLSSMLDAIDADGALDGVDLILSGYLADPAQADIVLDAVRRVKAKRPTALYVCDPVMGDSGRAFVPEPVMAAMKRLLAPAADVLVPNLWELGALTAPVLTLSEAIDAARSLKRTVVVTSAPAPHGVGVLHIEPDQAALLLATPLAPNAPKGAGDLFAALYAGRRALGEPGASAAALAMGSVFDIIERSAGAPHLAIVAGQSELVHPKTQPATIVYAGDGDAKNEDDER